MQRNLLPIDKYRNTQDRWPPTNLPQVYITLLHQNSMTYYRKHCNLVPINPLPANPTKVYRALLHQDSMILQNADILSVNVPPNQVHLYRTLLHQDSVTYWTMQRYVVPINLPTPLTPLNRAQVYRALLHQHSMTLQNADVPSANWPSHIKPKCIEAYYTRTLWPITECIGT